MTTVEPAPAPTWVGWETVKVEACGGTVALRKSGAGTPVLVLPRDNGHAPANAFLEGLAREHTVYYPWLPGFHGGDPEAWEWLTNVRDLAMVMREVPAALGLDRPALLGLGFGGWLAAEMAAMGPNSYSKLVLVAPMGIRPEHGFILDQFIISTENYARKGFANDEAFDAVYGAEPDFDQLESWETDREMTSRLAWKPYMYDTSLPRLLASVTIPALVVGAGSDEVVPADAVQAYAKALPNATLAVVTGSGHAVDLEQPEALAAKVAPFLRS